MITFGSAISILKNAQILAKKLKDRELNDALLSLQQELIELGSQNIELKEKYDELKKYIEIPDNIDLDDDGFIYRKDDVRKYCPSCWNKNRRLSLMPRFGVMELNVELDKPYTYECSACHWRVYSSHEHF